MENKEYEKQLDVKEVRIGNIVYGAWYDQDANGEDIIRYSLCKITGVDDNGQLGEGWSYMLENIDHPETDYHHGLCGVELTEEWLLKLGFEKKQIRIDLKNKFGDYAFSLKNVSFFTLIQDNDGFMLSKFETYIITVKYIHELQNLIYALTGEELKIKEL